MKIKETIFEIFDRIYTIIILILISPLLILLGYCFARDQGVRGNGE